MHRLAEITGWADPESRGFTVGECAILVVHHRGEFYGYLNSCPHRSIPLEWQPDQFLDYEKQHIQCSTHAALFEIESGECITGPCVGDRLDPVKLTVNAEQLFVELP